MDKFPHDDPWTNYGAMRGSLIAERGMKAMLRGLRQVFDSDFLWAIRTIPSEMRDWYRQIRIPYHPDVPQEDREMGDAYFVVGLMYLGVIILAVVLTAIKVVS